MNAMREAKELAESNHRIYGTQLSEALLSAVQGAFNERERLREALGEARRFIVSHVCSVRDDEAFHASQTCKFREAVAAIDTALNEQKGE